MAAKTPKGGGPQLSSVEPSGGACGAVAPGRCTWCVWGGWGTLLPNQCLKLLLEFVQRGAQPTELPFGFGHLSRG
jgi:hypothetical protein